MKLNGWISARGPYRRDGELYMDIKVNMWHPGFWFCLVKAWVRSQWDHS